MAKISKKKSVSIKGVLQMDSNELYVQIEDGELMPLSEVLADFDNCEITMSVAETVDLA